MPKETKDDSAPDFSNYFNKNKPKVEPEEQQEPDSGVKWAIKKYGPIVFAVVTTTTALYLSYYYFGKGPQPAGKYEPPTGYQIVTPNNEPPKLQKK